MVDSSYDAGLVRFPMSGWEWWVSSRWMHGPFWLLVSSLATLSACGDGEGGTSSLVVAHGGQAGSTGEEAGATSTVSELGGGQTAGGSSEIGGRGGAVESGGIGHGGETSESGGSSHGGVTAASGGANHGGETPESGGTSPIGGAPGSGGTAGETSCTLLATPEEIASTPRSDENLEMMAIEHRDTESVVADQATYDRLVRDIGAIRLLQPEVAGIDFLAEGRLGKRWFVVEVSHETAQAIENSEYHAWDCLNEGYGVQTTEILEPIDSCQRVLLTFRGLFDIEELSAAYLHLPGVLGVRPYWDNGPGLQTTHDICLRKESTFWRYMFVGLSPIDDGFKSFYYFTVSEDGVIIESEYYSAEDEPNTTRPSWSQTFEDCYGT